LIVFMAVTSAMSSELIAVSSIFTYDIYQTYVKPDASGKRLIYTSHVMVCVFGTIMAGFSTGLWYGGISLGYIYLMMGVIISSPVIPATLTLMWEGFNWHAATFSPPLGLACSLIAWLVTAKKEGGDLSVASTGANNPMLAGNVVALLSPLIFIPIFTLVFGVAKYDWVSMKEIRKGDDGDILDANDLEHDVKAPRPVNPADDEEEQRKLLRASFIAKTFTVVLTLALLILWPMPMYGTGYVFSQKFFTGWVVVGIMWLFFSIFAVGLYPLFEGRHSLKHNIWAIFKDITGKEHPSKHHGPQATYVEGKDVGGTDSPADVEADKKATDQVTTVEG